MAATQYHNTTREYLIWLDHNKDEYFILSPGQSAAIHIDCELVSTTPYAILPEFLIEVDLERRAYPPILKPQGRWVADLD